MIEVEDLSFRFRGSPRQALCRVSLAVAPGEFVVIAGPSGCGKSTLALALGGYLFRQYDGEAEGRVRVNGVDVRGELVYDVAETVGLVQQNPEAQFCTLTVDDEVAFGLENRCLPAAEIRERMAWALGIVGGRHLAGRSLAALSGGEKQKVAVAAMMAARPRVLILDEPTSNLDPTATAEVFAVIERLRAEAGITVIVVEHKLEYLRRFAPRLVRMAAGRIVYDGPYTTKDTKDIQDPQIDGADSVGGNDFSRCCTTDLAPGPDERREPPVLRSEPLVRVQDLVAGYDGVPVLHGVSLEVHPGEFVAVMGDNGSGKTTWLYSLLGLIKPLRGRVEVAGLDTRRVPASRLARHVAFVFQNPDHQLFADSVWGEATFAARNLGVLDAAAEVAAAGRLARAGLGDRGADHPYRLSYGEKRRLNLISVLGHGARLLLLDELLIGQDPDSAAWLLDLVAARVAHGDAAILVNHAPEVTRRYAGRVLFFRGGRVAVDAPPEAAFRQLATLGCEAYAGQD